MIFGKERDTTLIDEEGSTLTTEKNFREGVANRPVRKTYEIRHRTDITDLLKISQIAQDLINDLTKLDTAIKFEPVKNDLGYHYIVECYTVLEFQSE